MHHRKRFQGDEVQASVEESTLPETTIIEESMEALQEWWSEL